MDHGGGSRVLPNGRDLRRVEAIVYAVAVATVIACSSPTFDTGSSAISGSPDAAPIDLDLVADEQGPHGIGSLTTAELDDEIRALKVDGSYHDLTARQRARFDALARRRSVRRSNRPVEDRAPDPNAYAGDPATAAEDVQP